jgi:DNA (cytosine-5)-methyltransferase 1
MPSKLRVLDLFSGIGGFSQGLGLTGGFETAAFCEIEKYPVSQLKKNFPGVPIYDDIKRLTAERLVSDGIGTIDVITGGYPCQPFSVAGKQKGEKDDRHLWPSMLEIIAQVRPTWVICENVTGHIALGLDQVLLDLENEGYSSRTFIIPACSVNAPHRRDRLWIVAHSSELAGGRREVHREPGNKGRETSATRGEGLRSENNEAYTNHIEQSSKDVADSDTERREGGLPGREDSEREGFNGHARCRSTTHRQPIENWWLIEPGMGRVANGIPGRVAKLKALGNAVVPQICMMIGQAILDFEDAKNP